MKMPVVKDAVEKLTSEQQEIAKHIIGREGRLRSSKPKDGNAAFVWRMVAFNISPKPEHHCVPVTADFGVQVPGETEWHYAKVRPFVDNVLNPIVDAIINNLPKEEWHGVHRWARALYGF